MGTISESKTEYIEGPEAAKRLQKLTEQMFNVSRKEIEKRQEEWVKQKKARQKLKT